MIEIRNAKDRGHATHGWLESYHTFSFADYYDPKFMGFRHLRVINEDRVQPGEGFGTHSHQNMEIVTYVLQGALEHKDSIGNTSVIRPGDVQRMSAGTGVRHSEFNSSRSDVVHFLQIWILPEQDGIPPSYEQKMFPPETRREQLRLIGSRDGRDGSVTIHQNVDLYAATLSPGTALKHSLAAGRHAWLQLAAGSVVVNGMALATGDGAAVRDESELRIVANEAAELLMFDLS